MFFLLRIKGSDFIKFIVAFIVVLLLVLFSNTYSFEESLESKIDVDIIESKLIPKDFLNSLDSNSLAFVKTFIYEEIEDGFVYELEYFEVDTDLKFDGNHDEILAQLSSYMNNFGYNNLQSDPNILQEEKSGNCQAYSLLSGKILNNSGIEVSYFIEGDHMYLKAKIHEDWWKIDYVKGVFEKEGNLP